MIEFGMRDIAISVVSAAVYGMACNLFLLFCYVIFGQFSVFATIFKNAVRFEGSIWSVKHIDFSLKRSEDEKEYVRAPKIILKMFLFTLGFYILSYAFLDGEIRIYMLLVSVISLFSTKNLFYSFLLGIIDRIFMVVCRILTVTLRIIFFPLRIFYCYLSKKIPLFRKMV